MSATQLLFVYGSLKRGFPNYDKYKQYLQDLRGEYQLKVAWPLLVLKTPCCKNPGCGLLHRMVALIGSPLPDVGILAKGELFGVSEEALDVMDGLEADYRRTDVAVQPLLPEPGAGEAVAVTYVPKDPSWFLELRNADQAEAVREYTMEMAKSGDKHCCQVNPGHAPPHDVCNLEPDDAGVWKCNCCPPATLSE